jgi:hypothetical protein
VKAFLSYALSVGGLGFVLAAVIGASIVNLSYPAARMQMLHMLQMSANKAEILCRTKRGTFYEALGAAMKIAAMAQTRDVQILASATRPSYDAGCIPVTLHWKKLFGRGKKGVLLVVAGLAVAIGVKTSPIFHINAAVLTGIAVGWFIYTRGENERSLMLARAEILPAIDQAFADGRYVHY